MGFLFIAGTLIRGRGGRHCYKLFQQDSPWSWRRRCCYVSASASGSGEGKHVNEALRVDEVEKILGEVRAQDVKTVNVNNQCEWTDYMVFATGKSDWHIRNIAQALIYNVKQKQKQKGGDQLVLPGVEGRDGGKWLVIDIGSIIVHALDENARAYYDLESLWTKERQTSSNQLQELESSLKKVRRTMNNKKAVV